MAGYYDLVLVLIPVALLGVGGALLLVGVPQPVAVSLAGTTAVGTIGHAIFVNAPVGSSRSGTQDDGKPPAGTANTAVQAD